MSEYISCPSLNLSSEELLVTSLETDDDLPPGRINATGCLPVRFLEFKAPSSLSVFPRSLHPLVLRDILLSHIYTGLFQQSIFYNGICIVGCVAIYLRSGSPIEYTVYGGIQKILYYL